MHVVTWRGLQCSPVVGDRAVFTMDQSPPSFHTHPSCSKNHKTQHPHGWRPYCGLLPVTFFNHCMQISKDTGPRNTSYYLALWQPWVSMQPMLPREPGKGLWSYLQEPIRLPVPVVTSIQATCLAGKILDPSAWCYFQPKLRPRFSTNPGPLSSSDVR